VDKFAASSERPKAKNVSASGGFCPLIPLGAEPPDLRYRLAHSARHGAVPPTKKKIQARTATARATAQNG